MLKYNKITVTNRTSWVVFIHGMGGSSNAFKKQVDAYKSKYNLLLIDLHGHGMSVDTPLNMKGRPTFRSIIKDIIEVLDLEKIPKAHFVGLSLGSLIIRALAEIAPEKITSITFAGAVLEYNWKIRGLLFIGNLSVGFLPYMILYKLFALMMLPRKNHRKSREIFVQEAQKLGAREFTTWFKLVQTINKDYPVKDFSLSPIPKLFIMGDEDHMFLDATKDYINNDENALLYIIRKCGHISNLEAADEFNRVSLEFINLQKEKDSLYKEYHTA